jgi:hypothetical protein
MVTTWCSIMAWLIFNDDGLVLGCVKIYRGNSLVLGHDL